MQTLSISIRVTFSLVQQMLCGPLVIKESLIKFIMNLVPHSRRLLILRVKSLSCILMTMADEDKVAWACRFSHLWRRNTSCSLCAA